MASDTPAAGVTTLIRPSDLNTFHRNARIGDVDVIESSLLVNGQYKPIVVNIGTHTGRPNEVLAGNHTLMAFRNLAERSPFDARWSKVKAHWVDVDDDRAERIVLVDNQSHEVGEGYDDSVVWELVQRHGVEGTGLDADDLDKLESALNRDPTEPPKPSLPGDRGNEPTISSTITFADEAQQEIWFSFITWLREAYPDPDLTVAGRFSAHLADTAAVRV